MEKIRLLIASDDPSSRRGLTSIFVPEEGYEVLGSFSLTEAVEKSIIFQPDVVMIDISGHAAKYGLNICQIKNECPCSLILALVGNDNSDQLAEVVSYGVDGCIPKGVIRGCLLKTVELAYSMGMFCLPGSAKSMVTLKRPDRLSNIPHQKHSPSNRSDFLTTRETEILQLMAKNYSNREIAAKLFIGEPTVKTHIGNILRKLGKSNRTEAVIYSYKNGIVS